MPLRIRGLIQYAAAPAQVRDAYTTPGHSGHAKSGRPWTAREMELVKALYAVEGSKVLAERLSRPFRAIQHKAAKMGIKRRNHEHL